MRQGRPKDYSFYIEFRSRGDAILFGLCIGMILALVFYIGGMVL